jgi:uncharacterized protein YcaQ
MLELSGDEVRRIALRAQGLVGAPTGARQEEQGAV